MATFLNYCCATRLSNDVGFWASCYETFQMMGPQFSSVLRACCWRALFTVSGAGEACGSRSQRTAPPACACRKASLMSIYTHAFEKCQFISVFLCVDKHLNPAISILMESLLACGFYCSLNFLKISLFSTKLRLLQK